MPLELISRDEWGAAPPSSTVKMLPGKDVCIHHTAGPFTSLSRTAEIAKVRGIQAFHMTSPTASPPGRGFADIAYNDLVAPSGRVYVGRGPGVKGGHLFDPLNYDWYGICFIGQYASTYPSPQKPTDEAMAAARELIALRVEQGWVREEFLLKGHQDFQLKACPGDSIYSRLAELRPTGEDEDEMAYADYKAGYRWAKNHPGEPNPGNEGDDFNFGFSVRRYIEGARKLPTPVPGPAGPAGPPGPASDEVADHQHDPGPVTRGA